MSISGAVTGLLEHVSNPALAPLGCAVPDAALLQSKRLDLALARAARQHGTRYNIYCAPQGDPRLRREIAKRAMHFGHALSPDDLLITNGCTEALTLALTAAARQGEAIRLRSNHPLIVKASPTNRGWSAKNGAVRRSQTLREPVLKRIAINVAVGTFDDV